MELVHTNKCCAGECMRLSPAKVHAVSRSTIDHQFGFHGQMSFENVCRRRINRLHGPKGIMGRRYIHHRCHPGWWINRGGGYSCRRCPGKDIHHPVIIHHPWVASQARWWIFLFAHKASAKIATDQLCQNGCGKIVRSSFEDAALVPNKECDLGPGNSGDHAPCALRGRTRAIVDLKMAPSSRQN